ncbi:Hypothetical predicted protein [Cloeon dipterum]|uniref:DUF7064 domain-containing protein n=3 Tax=Cloeon dipterum TaxID=197152 RepID=A0A8S1BQA7_9INSE|nr:Hypothetical predicted protein [Cloeon dipterum]
MSYFYLVLAVLSITVARFLNMRDPPPIMGVYTRPGKWYFLKFLIFFSMLHFRKFLNKMRSEKVEANQSGYGVKSRSSPDQMDCSQPLSSDEKAIDAVYFNAASKDGQYMVVATARRPKGVINGFLYLQLPQVGLLMSPKLPDTTLQQTKEEEEAGVFGAEGLKLEPIEPMKRWKLTYNGKMRLSEAPEKELSVVLNAEWKSNLPVFDFDTDMDPSPVARALAKETWSREFFQILKEAHQSHYEQHGDIEGVVTIDGVKYPLNLNSMRDHSYGHKREWKNFHRYALHMGTLEDGTRFCASIVSCPINFSQIELGYLYKPNGHVVPLQRCDLQLYQHGEDGTPPLDYAFNFWAGDKKYCVQVKVLHTPEFYIADEWEARVVERMVTFRVNGIAGWGIAEWEYRNTMGKVQH